MQISLKQIKKFQQKILNWYAEHKRDLPWRASRDPYRILVSEIMLQQTQVSRVIPKYVAWLDAFPTVESLANAKTSEVLRLWLGLGYNRRALNLQKAALMITSEYKGEWPKTVEGLKRLPGIGEYTARAVACFAFDQQVAVVDTNVKKVILVEFRISENSDGTQKARKFRESDTSENLKHRVTEFSEKEIQALADSLLPMGRAYDWNQALMDYASAVLKKEILQSRTKQPKFKGSNRYYRGKLVKLLLEKQTLKVGEVGSSLKDDFSIQDTQWLSDLLQGLEKDGFIKKDKNIVKIV